MITEEQREERRNGIGGSDMPIILGLPDIIGLKCYKTPYQLYLEKKGIISTCDEMSQAQEWGTLLEPVVRDKFADKNKVLIQTPDTIIHPFFDFMRGNVDGYIVNWDSVLEVKCADKYMAYQWGESGSDVIPMAYLIQVAHYCSVMNKDSAHIAVLIGGNDYRQYKYTRDFSVEKTIIESGTAFWDAVKNDNAPPPINQIDLRIMFPQHTSGKSINISDEIYNKMLNLQNAKTKIKELQEIEEESRFTIMKYMNDAECLTDEEGNPLITWKTNKRGSRTFLLKGEK